MTLNKNTGLLLNNISKLENPKKYYPVKINPNNLNHKVHNHFQRLYKICQKIKIRKNLKSLKEVTHSLNLN